MKNTPILKVENLSQYFTSGKGRNKTTVKAVDGVSFEIYEGETFGLGGESGCGKTTTGRTIIRLYDPTDGKVFYKDKEISGKMNEDLRKYLTDNMAMIFQDPIASLNPRMTVREIIGEGLKVRGITNQDIKDEMILTILNKVGLLPEHATRYPHEFSGGQRQRIGIARALVINPSFIIADEPISALDVSVQAQVINLLDDLKDQFGLTILFIAHDLSVVKYFSDRIGVMYYGKIVENEIEFTGIAGLGIVYDSGIGDIQAGFRYIFSFTDIFDITDDTYYYQSQSSVIGFSVTYFIFSNK